MLRPWHHSALWGLRLAFLIVATPHAGSTEAGSIPEGCISWSDGCNLCKIVDGNVAACTDVTCTASLGSPKCLEYVIAADAPIRIGCATWFDGCNTCSVDDGEVPTCTLLVCQAIGEATCLQFKAEEGNGSNATKTAETTLTLSTMDDMHNGPLATNSPLTTNTTPPMVNNSIWPYLTTTSTPSSLQIVNQIASKAAERVSGTDVPPSNTTAVIVGASVGCVLFLVLASLAVAFGTRSDDSQKPDIIIDGDSTEDSWGRNKHGKHTVDVSTGSSSIVLVSFHRLPSISFPHALNSNLIMKPASG